jgi:serine/threonine-protein kinase
MPSHPLLAGRYRLEGQIATGGVGEVWRAEDTVLTRPVAVKLLRAEFAGHAEMQERFRAEARHAGALSHPAIARVYDYCEPAPEHPAFLVMELVDGPSLAAVLAAGPLGAAQTLDVVAQVASGLQTAHAAALVHRDIKPANLLLAADGQVKITDFGIAHVAGSVPVTRTGTVMGTPAYLAPERVSGASATPASDLYSLGVVAYECLAGAQPFTGKPLEVAASHRDLPLPPFPHAVPADVAQLVAELTAKNPAARPASAQEVAARAAGLREDMAGGVGGAAAGWLYSVPDTVADIPAPAAAVRLNPTLGWQTERPEPAVQAQRARRVRRHQQAERAPRGQRPPQAGRPRRPRGRWRIAGAASVAVAAVAATALVALALSPRPARTPSRRGRPARPPSRRLRPARR